MKKLLLSLFGGLILSPLLYNFGFCDTFPNGFFDNGNYRLNDKNAQSGGFKIIPYGNSTIKLSGQPLQYLIRYSYSNGIKFKYVGQDTEYSASNSNLNNIVFSGQFLVECEDECTLVFTGLDGVGYYGKYKNFSGLSFCPECPTCPSQYTSEECQTEYDLIPSSDLSTCNNNLQSCQSSLSGRNNTLNNCSNNLLSCESSLSSCIQSNCPIDTGSVMWSSIWINGIQHLGKPVINIDIPSNIYWDYSTNDEQFDLYIGSGYDQEYIDGVIAVNSYRPSSEDFTSIFVGGLTLVFPYIIIALFIIFIRKLIKRIFK